MQVKKALRCVAYDGFGSRHQHAARIGAQMGPHQISLFLSRLTPLLFLAKMISKLKDSSDVSVRPLSVYPNN
jgi:hypothetical protein